MAKTQALEFPSDRNQTEQAIAYALERGEDIQPDELQMLLMLQDDPAELLLQLRAKGWKPPKKPA